MKSEKPLHVRVAEALGCKPVQATDPEARRRHEESGMWGACWCANGGDDKGPHSASGVPTTELARYDTDWAATGPLIERYYINLESLGEHGWEASNYPGGLSILRVTDTTPLLAACKLILYMKADGTLG